MNVSTHMTTFKYVWHVRTCIVHSNTWHVHLKHMTYSYDIHVLNVHESYTNRYMSRELVRSYEYMLCELVHVNIPWMYMYMSCELVHVNVPWMYMYMSCELVMSYECTWLHVMWVGHVYDCNLCTCTFPTFTSAIGHHLHRFIK